MISWRMSPIFPLLFVVSATLSAAAIDFTFMAFSLGRRVWLCVRSVAVDAWVLRPTGQRHAMRSAYSERFDCGLVANCDGKTDR